MIGTAHAVADAASPALPRTDVIDVILAFQTSLDEGGWPPNWAEDVPDENLAIADDLPVGTVIGRQLDGFLVRAIRLGG